MDDRGRIYLPKKIRRKLKVREGDILYLTLEGDKLKLLTPSLIKEELKSKVPE